MKTGAHFEFPVPPPKPTTMDAIHGTWETRRMPDAVKAAALANAVDLCCRKTADNYEDVLEIARAFEAYLAGEEAHGAD